MARAQIVLFAGLAVLALGTAALAVGIALAVTAGGGGSEQAALPAASEVAQLLDGIRQDGVELGAQDAPVTLVEYADLQCPYCAAWSAHAFAELVRDYVRPGKLKLVFRGLAFLGPDSERALRFALAAGLQDRMWHAVDLLYRYQGPENAGWVTDQLLRSIGESIEGLDVETASADLGGSPVTTAIAETAKAADADRVEGTPTFLLGLTGKRLELFRPKQLDAASFRSKLDELLPP